jgi:hypothetical protein
LGTLLSLWPYLALHLLSSTTLGCLSSWRLGGSGRLSRLGLATRPLLRRSSLLRLEMRDMSLCHSGSDTGEEEEASAFHAAYLVHDPVGVVVLTLGDESGGCFGWIWVFVPCLLLPCYWWCRTSRILAVVICGCAVSLTARFRRYGVSRRDGAWQ